MSVMHINENNFQELVLQSSKPVLLDFWADWCGPCRMIAPAVEAVAQERSDILVGKVNVDQAPGLANQFQIMSIPTLVVLRDGKVVNHAVGVRSKTQILSML